MTPAAVLDALAERRVVAVVRAPCSRGAVDTANALRRGGLTAVEITRTTPNAMAAVEASVELDGVIDGAAPCDRSPTSKRRSEPALRS